jgi:hypothetical protein
MKHRPLSDQELSFMSLFFLGIIGCLQDRSYRATSDSDFDIPGRRVAFLPDAGGYTIY